MTERFDTWPHDAEGIVKEALREYVGDGDGKDEEVLAAYRKTVVAEARSDGYQDGHDDGYAEGWQVGYNSGREGAFADMERWEQGIE